MCGIAGIVGESIEGEVKQRALDSMMRALRHRGPDDEGIWISSLNTANSAGFAATRLAILDLSAAGHQPMTTDDGRYSIAFNGEIYNFAELRSELLVNRYSFRSGGDTEVVLQSFASFGPSCVQKFRGMFAFAIWDEQTKSCFLARDPFGIKPLYYYLDLRRQLFIFASEIRALLASRLVPRKLSAAGLSGYFRFGSVQEPETMLEEIKCLPAGSTLRFSEGSISINRYWRPDFPESAPEKIRDDARAPEVVREALIDTVRAHFVSDVPVGIFLSGGIDSTAIAIAARAVRPKSDLRTFSIGVDDPGFDESELAKKTAQLLRTNHCESRLDAGRARELFGKFLDHIDQPTVDGFNTFAVSKLAHEQGLKVVLSGLGGDELFAGYPTFRNIPRLLNISRSAGDEDSFRRKLLLRVLKVAATAPRWRRLGRFLENSGADMVTAYEAYRGIFTSDEAQRLVSQITNQNVFERPAPCSTELDKELQNAISQIELERYMRNQLLRDSDVMSMAWSLELRLPFVDRVFFKTIRGISPRIRLQSGKKILLDALPEIPEWIRKRRKRGFLFPFMRWGVGEWFGQAKLRARYGLSSQTSWYQLWCLWVFENWWNRISE